MLDENKLACNAFHAKKRRTLGKLAALSILPCLPNMPAFANNSMGQRVALVIGNGMYPGAPLRNPPNDANAIASTLKNLNFDVDLKIDCTRDMMNDSIHIFCDRVEQRSAIALFYFAGHGVQLNWHNYLLPVDIRLAAVGDVPRQTVDISSLMSSLAKMRNPMNIVILDACRNDPFGIADTSGAGLSQMDAPTRTILAYATAPGNVASDGSGKNGLYTENLLREIVRPDAKIEDVFKRVRLAVRLQSQGKQIPWESTSLEDDFYFIPPPSANKPTDEQLDQSAQIDKDDWAAAKEANSADAIAGYLKTHPNGNFCELAQATLDKLLAERGEQKVIVKNDVSNPFTQGSTDARAMRLGDIYTYRHIDLYSKQESQSTQRVTMINDTLVEFNDGRLVTDLLGNLRVDSDGNRYSDRQSFASDYAIGKSWKSRYERLSPSGDTDTFEFTFRVVSRESITIPAGTFDAFCVHGEGWRLNNSSRRTFVYWIAPDRVPRYLSLEFARYGGGRRGSSRAHEYYREELIDFDAGKSG
jgi:Caspase domain